MKGFPEEAGHGPRLYILSGTRDFIKSLRALKGELKEANCHLRKESGTISPVFTFSMLLLLSAFHLGLILHLAF